MDYPIEIRRPCIGDTLPQSLDNYSGVIVFGGPMSAYEDNQYEFLHQELEWIPRVLDSGTPFFGICLGAQLLAKVLGAKVEPHPQGLYEIGYFPIFPTRLGRDLFQRAEAMHVFQWHKDGFELPQGATLLASGQRFENQAFSYGKAIVGVQFHPELTPATMLQWTKLGHRRRLPGIQALNTMKRTRDKHEKFVRGWTQKFLNTWLQSDRN